MAQASQTFSRRPKHTVLVQFYYMTNCPSELQKGCSCEVWSFDTTDCAIPPSPVLTSPLPTILPSLSLQLFDAEREGFWAFCGLKHHLLRWRESLSAGPTGDGLLALDRKVKKTCPFLTSSRLLGILLEMHRGPRNNKHRPGFCMTNWYCVALTRVVLVIMDMNNWDTAKQILGIGVCACSCAAPLLTNALN